MSPTRPPGQTSTLFAKWEIVILLLSLIVSCTALWMSIRTERFSSSANIQIVEAVGIRGYYAASSPTEEVQIRCKVVLKNVGRAPTQIVDYKFEPMVTGSYDPKKFWVALSDSPGIKLGDPMNRELFYSRRLAPLANISKPTIEGGESKTLSVQLHGATALMKGIEAPLFRSVFVLSNGQTLTVVPEIVSSGVTVSW